MPEANVLYSVTAVVVVGLVAWVAVVLKNAKEPWARDVPPPPKDRGDDVPVTKDPLPKGEEKDADEKADKAEKKESSPPSSSLPKIVSGGTDTPADATAPATAVVLAKKDDKKDEEKKDEEKKDEEKKD